jgi:D-tyrosyl-tRNA(Tyr) deacylase
MKIVLQRVSEARVTVDKSIVGEIGKGLLLLVGISSTDTETDLEFMAEKMVNLRIFNDNDDKMNLSLLDVEGEILAVSQFTLFGDTRKGRRPSFVNAGSPEIASPLFDNFVARLTEKAAKVATGVFGAKMEVSLVNEGPVTLIFEHPDPSSS